MKNIKSITFLSTTLLLFACGGGGGGGKSDNDDNNSGGGTTIAAEPAERYVLTGNNDGTLSVFRNNLITGYSTVIGYFNAGAGFSIRDMAFDEDNGRLVLISTGQVIVISLNETNGAIEVLDTRSTSGNSSHLALNAAGSVVYVASGASTNQNVDVFKIAGDGTLSANTPSAPDADPDYIKLSPDESHLYVVSRTDDLVNIFNVNSDGSLAAGPATVNTDTDPTAIGFSSDGLTAYVTRQNNSDNLVIYRVDANTGNLSQTSSYTNSNGPIDMILGINNEHLYVLDSSNKNINHYTIDATTGEPTFFASTNLSFTPTDLDLSRTGSQLYVSHSEDDLVSTIDIDENNGALTVVNWVRTFSAAQSVVAIGGAGTQEPVATYLFAPDESGLSRFSVASDGMLTLEMTENTSGALVDGEVAVDYAKNLLLGTGENATNADLLASYEFDPLVGMTTAVDSIDATVSADSAFKRVELGGSGRFMYVLDVDQLGGGNQGYIRSYAYAVNGTITASSVDNDLADEAPENLSLHPAGRFIYSINSFGDTISRFEVNENNGTLSGGTLYTPGGNGSGVGRPLDMQFHPNGRYAYVSLEDDSEVVRYEIETNGALSNINRTGLPQFNATDVEPAPLAVHPNGKFLYVGERGNANSSIAALAINQSNYSLTFQSRIATTENNPSWISVDPQGKFLLVRYTAGDIQVFNIDQSTGELSSSTQTVSAGSGSDLHPSITLVAPLQ